MPSSEGAIPIEEFLRTQNEEGAAEAKRLATEQGARERHAAKNPNPPPTPLDEVRAEHERLAGILAGAEQEAARAGEKVAETEGLVADLTAKITAHDGGRGIEKLASDRAVAQAKLEAFTARLSERMDALHAARAAAKVAARSLDKAKLAAGLVEVDAARAGLDERVAAFATTLAPEVATYHRRHGDVAQLNTRIRIASGAKDEDLYIGGIRPPMDVEALAAAFGRYLAAAIDAARRQP